MKQRLFDRAVGGVIHQGGPSRTEQNGCAYRSKDGRRCAVGWILEDAHYTRDFDDYSTVVPLCPTEATDVRHLRLLNALNMSVGAYLSVDALKLLQELQMAHDQSAEMTDTDEEFLTLFTQRCKTIAQRYELSADVLDRGARASFYRKTAADLIARAKILEQAARDNKIVEIQGTTNAPWRKVTELLQINNTTADHMRVRP